MTDMPISDFADKINELMPLIMKEFGRRQTNELYKGKISLPQFLLLDFLSSQDGAKMTDLAKFMEVSTPAVTGIVDRLVRDRYVVRAYDARDRRIVKIKITAKGVELVKRIHRQRRQRVVKIFGKISALERSEYLKILRHIHDILLAEKAVA